MREIAAPLEGKVQADIPDEVKVSMENLTK